MWLPFEGPEPGSTVLQLAPGENGVLYSKRPQLPFMPRFIVAHVTPLDAFDQVLVTDIVIGKHSQLVSGGLLPLRLLTPELARVGMIYDCIQPGSRAQLRVRNESEWPMEISVAMASRPPPPMDLTIDDFLEEVHGPSRHRGRR